MANTITITGVTEAIARLSNIDKVAKRQIIEIAERIHELTVEGAEKHSKAKTSTGALVRSLGSGPDAIPGGWIVGHNKQEAPHALWVHWGARAHDIRPKKKKVLRWVGSDGRFVFAKQVHHPGYKGDAYMVPAVNQAIAELRARTLKV